MSTDGRLSGAALQHRSDIRRACRIGEQGGLEILGRQTMPDSQRKDADHLVHVWPQMGTHDVIGFIVDQNLVAVDRFRLLAGSKPSGVFSVCIRTFIPFSFTLASLRPTVAMGGMVKATLGTPL